MSGPNTRPWPMSALLYAAAALVVAVSVFPLLYALSTSLKTGSALFDPGFIPPAASLANYRSLLTDGEQPFVRQVLNSIGVATAVVAVSLALSVLAAWALGRIRFRGRGLLLIAILTVSMFPQVAVLAGMFELVRAVGLYNRAYGLVLPYLVITLPFTVWVLTTYMTLLPKELEEAAVMDGCGPLRTLLHVFLPLMGPALVSTGLLAFIAAWNEFLFALTFVLDNDQRTVPVAISLISGAGRHEVPWGQVMAASVLVTLPLIAGVLVFQRRIVSGLTAGAVKG